MVTLLWRHNGRDGVSNHQPPDFLLNRLVRRRSKSALLALYEWNSPHKGSGTQKMFPFDDVIMRHMWTWLSDPQLWKFGQVDLVAWQPAPNHRDMFTLILDKMFHFQYILKLITFAFHHSLRTRSRTMHHQNTFWVALIGSTSTINQTVKCYWQTLDVTISFSKVSLLNQQFLSSRRQLDHQWCLAPESKCEGPSEIRTFTKVFSREDETEFYFLVPNGCRFCSTPSVQAR